MTQANKHFNQSFYHRDSLSPNNQCTAIKEYFYQLLEEHSTLLTKTHFFHGRYENIYLKELNFKPLQNVLHHAKQKAAVCLGCTTAELSMDYWFNDMPPSHITDWHRHDVMDEQISGVYYIKVPENSGNLLIKNNHSVSAIKPKENDIIFFNPDIEHSVEKNQSTESRLSIGMNFGYLKDKL